MRQRSPATGEGGSRHSPRSALVIFFVCLTSCATLSSHQFTQPAGDWQVRTGQLMYRNAKTTLIGDVIVRFAKRGDLELIFSKGPGVPLLVLRQDAQFAQMKGPLARNGWSGPVQSAPRQLRGWLTLRERLLRAQDQKTIRYSADNEMFWVRF